MAAAAEVSPGGAARPAGGAAGGVEEDGIPLPARAAIARALGAGRCDARGWARAYHQLIEREVLSRPQGAEGPCAGDAPGRAVWRAGRLVRGPPVRWHLARAPGGAVRVEHAGDAPPEPAPAPEALWVAWGHCLDLFAWEPGVAAAATIAGGAVTLCAAPDVPDWYRVDVWVPLGARRTALSFLWRPAAHDNELAPCGGLPLPDASVVEALFARPARHP